MLSQTAGELKNTKQELGIILGQCPFSPFPNSEPEIIQKNVGLGPCATGKWTPSVAWNAGGGTNPAEPAGLLSGVPGVRCTNKPHASFAPYGLLRAEVSPTAVCRDVLPRQTQALALWCGIDVLQCTWPGGSLG